MSASPTENLSRPRVKIANILTKYRKMTEIQIKYKNLLFYSWYIRQAQRSEGPDIWRVSYPIRHLNRWKSFLSFLFCFLPRCKRMQSVLIPGKDLSVSSRFPSIPDWRHPICSKVRMRGKIRKLLSEGAEQ